MKYCIVAEETIYSNIFKIMFDEVIDNNNVFFLDHYLNETSFRKQVFSILYKNKLNDILDGKFEKILSPKLALIDFLNENEESIIIFLNGSIQKVYRENNLKKIKKMFPKSKFVLLFVDSIFQKQAQRAYNLAKKGIFDLVYSYDYYDSRENNFIFTNSPYSKMYSFSSGKKGVYFCGSNKGRVDFLDDIAKYFEKNNIDYTFKVFGVKSKESYHFPILESNYKPYDELLKETMKYNCILDIVQAGREKQAGLSLRVYEATVYNKVLITNNINIFDYKLYDPRYMHYIERAEDIDPSWIADSADYNYCGQLSPVKFLDDIRTKLQ